MPRIVRTTSRSQRFNPIGRSQSKEKTAAPMASNGPLPVTLLSGFLGAGKTTLLQHILTQDHGLRIAVVVNDIGAVNVDASIIQNHRLTQTEEKVVAMQNGCICCTLRGDLLEELVKLSKLQEFDYIIIESSGISEPEQVAETFDQRMAEQISLQAVQGDIEPSLVSALEEIQKAGGLEKFAKLDTTVTVIDSFTMLNDFDTQDLLSARRDDVTAEDERTVSDLMVDQIEFANVIILNKLDMIDDEKKKQLLHVIKSLNPLAKIIETSRGRVDPREIVNTKLFNLEVAKTGYGWLRDLHEMTVRQINGRSVVAPQPETEEYDVRNFVYHRMRPFHPRRLQKLIYDKFILQLGEDEDDEDEEDEGDEDMAEAPRKEDTQNQDSSVEAASADGDSDATSSETKDSNESSKSQSTDPTEPDDEDDEEDDLYAPENDVILANKRAHPVFSGLYRSKGTIWLATRPNMRGSWSQAGAMLTLVGDMPFFCTVDPEQYLTGSPDIDGMLQHSIDKGGEWGDREIEIVFIGYKLDKQRLSEQLDECLLTDEEWEQWQSVMRNEELDLEGKVQQLYDLFDDGFPEWEGEDEHDHDHEGHDHGHDHSHNQVRNISDHAEEMQEIREVD